LLRPSKGEGAGITKTKTDGHPPFFVLTPNRVNAYAMAIWLSNVYRCLRTQHLSFFVTIGLMQHFVADLVSI
jgi:hypothetical protein